MPGSGALASGVKHARGRTKKEGDERQDAQQHNARITQIGDPPAGPGDQSLDNNGPNHPRGVLAG